MVNPGHRVKPALLGRLVVKVCQVSRVNRVRLVQLEAQGVPDLRVVRAVVDSRDSRVFQVE